jgi:hypothetical protein
MILKVREIDDAGIYIPFSLSTDTFFSYPKVCRVALL